MIKNFVLTGFANWFFGVWIKKNRSLSPSYQNIPVISLIYKYKTSYSSCIEYDLYTFIAVNMHMV